MRAPFYPAAFALAMLTPTAAFPGTFYKCVKDGKTTYSDEPCDGAIKSQTGAPVATAPTVSSSRSPTQGPPLLTGDWRGQAQFDYAVANRSLDDAHAVVPIVVSAAEDGKITGISPENGCHLLGLWSPGMLGQFINVDVTLSNCRFTQLNRRYHGQLFQQGEGRAQLYVTSLSAVLQTPASAEIKAMLRR